MACWGGGPCGLYSVSRQAHLSMETPKMNRDLIRIRYEILHAWTHAWTRRGMGAGELSPGARSDLHQQVERMLKETRDRKHSKGVMATTEGSRVGFVVSPCLLGIPCRYDGGTKNHQRVWQEVENSPLTPIPLCTEVLAGLGLPRPPMQFEGTGSADGAADGDALLEGHADLVNSEGVSCGKRMEAGARLALELARTGKCTKAILKARSPSCGLHQVYSVPVGYGASKEPKPPLENKGIQQGRGVFAHLLVEASVDCVTEEDLSKMDRFLPL